MLANPQRNLHERHRQHRRQISTPSALEAAKAPSLPAQALHRYHAHRRGQSFDQRSLPMQRPQAMRDGTFTTNPSVTGPQQPPHMIGEQQHQIYMRAAQPSFSQLPMTMPMVPECQDLCEEDLRALTNRSLRDSQSTMAYATPNMIKLDGQNLDNRPMNTDFNLIQHHSKVSCNNPLDSQLLENGTWNLYSNDNLGPAFANQTNAVPADMRRLSMQSDVQIPQQPRTPKHPTNTHYVPITPATTPFKRSVDLAQYSDMQPTPTKGQNCSMPGSAQSSYMQRAKSLQGVAGTTFTQPKIEMPSPPHTASFEMDNFDTFDCQQGSSFEIPKSENFAQSQYASSSASSSFHSSPVLAAMPCPGDENERPDKLPIYPATPSRPSLRKSPSVRSSTSSASKAKLSPKNASIENLNLDDRVHASIKETGVTMDEIASFIHGPDPDDGKWVCLHPGCERRFGRKENIKSHVQTHLGDRQYKCDHCNKCFVRGHDLKRHAKIHTGDKPYECLCGNVFARHDALTRHRQRGMCIGGYKGIVRKTTKRGRPKKHRPETEEQQQKTSKTRQKLAEKFLASLESDTSRNSPPSEVFENMSLRAPSPATEMPVFNNPNYSLPPEVFTFTPPASPGGTHDHGTSPTYSERSVTPSTEDEMLPLSPSKGPLDKIIEEHGMPSLTNSDACPYTDACSTTHALSSPHTAPILTDSSHGPDLDIFISQAPSTGFGKHEFPDLADPDMASFPDYVNSSFEPGMDLFSGKGFSAGPPMSDDFFSFQFQVDEQPSDVMTREFLMD
ncbi:putative C2H2 transcription factor (Swi5) [Aspergillus melleus]|uniref:putative C2H2 transcription factor (Swi5) n=1 Tax=Aspergillus melleus TaxID=138277 RepID=UPI001E8E12C4|nr:Metallothionein expression activator [Aspergillus melleus]KAH8426977.1 Metallothionein expression activator [Aspergillus melleus]